MLTGRKHRIFYVLKEGSIGYSEEIKMSVGKRETDDWIEDHRKAWKRVRKCVDMKPSKRKTVQNGYRISDMETRRTAGEMRCRQAGNERLIN